MLFLLIGFTCLFLQFFLPWWIIGPVAFGFCFWKSYSGGYAFRSSFYAIFVLWAVVGLILTIENEHLLANRVGQMFMLPEWDFNWAIVLLISSLIGGLAAGFAGAAGFYFRGAFEKR